MKCKRCNEEKDKIPVFPEHFNPYWECPKCDKLICTKCGIVPFCAESWWIPRGLFTGDPRMLCPNCRQISSQIR